MRSRRHTQRMQHDAGAGGEERGRRRLDACRRACVAAGIIAIVALIAILRPVVKWQRPWSVASSSGTAAKMDDRTTLQEVTQTNLWTNNDVEGSKGQELPGTATTPRRRATSAARRRSVTIHRCGVS